MFMLKHYHHNLSIQCMLRAHESFSLLVNYLDDDFMLGFDDFLYHCEELKEFVENRHTLNEEQYLLESHLTQHYF